MSSKSNFSWFECVPAEARFDRVWALVVVLATIENYIQLSKRCVHLKVSNKNHETCASVTFKKYILIYHR